MAEIRERCGLCGSDFSIGDGVPPDDWIEKWMILVESWRRFHSCSSKKHSVPETPDNRRTNQQTKENIRGKILAEEAIHAGIIEVKAEDIYERIEYGPGTGSNRRDGGHGREPVDAVHPDSSLRYSAEPSYVRLPEGSDHYVGTYDYERGMFVSEAEHEAERTPGGGGESLSPERGSSDGRSDPVVLQGTEEVREGGE